MKELGELFKDKREDIGISFKEVANDLKVDPILIENLEEGNNKVFKDVLELKNVVSSYAKYLGLDSEEAIDMVNDYLFEKTSKISIEDVKNSLKEEKDDKKIRSPYTSKINKNPKKLYLIFMIILALLVLFVIFYFVLKNVYVR